MFMMSFFEIPRGVLEKIDCFRSRFYWQNDQHNRKYRLVKWNLICQPKLQGGLGVQNLDIQNKCLMSKWLFKLCNEDGLWQQLLQNKYIRDKTLGNCSKKPTDSHFSKGLMNVKTEFMRYGRFNLMDGTQTRFWEDTWLGNQPLSVRFPALFNIVRRKHDSVATVLSSIPLNVSFRRALVGNNLRSWNQIVSSLHDVNLQAGRDVFVWTLHSSSQFSVRSFYAALISNGVRVSQVGKLKYLLRLEFSCGI